MNTVTCHNGHDRPLFRLDARVKLLAALAMLAMVLSSHGFAFPLLVAVLGGTVCLAAGIRPSLLLLRFAEPLLVAGVVVLLKLFFSGKVPLFTVSILGLSLTGHMDGLREGGLIAGRIAGAVAVMAAVCLATPFTELMGALAWLRLPRGLVEVMVFAWRSLFLLFDDAQVVYAAQKNRLGYAGFRRGLSSFGTLTGALVIKAFDSSQAMTVAMVQRGYDGTLPIFRHKPLRAGELLGATALVSILGWVWRL